jgi:aldehyde:ferredoxin oxidoreductase
MFGYHGRYLRIDATTGATDVVELREGVLRHFIGGVGLAAWLLHRECPWGIDPVDPANPLAFVFSPLVGTPVTTSAKFAVAAKSPLTDRFCDALSSSHFAIEGKKTGFDAIVIRGRAATPSVLVVDDGAVRLEPAGDLWGRATPVATALLRERFGPGWSFAVIGPAGENLVRFATISHDNRHAGRGGLGAVLGSKNLKAVAVRGTKRTPVADPAGVVAAAKDLSARSFGPATQKYRELGTVANLLTFNRLNALPTRNFTAGQFEGADAISGEALNAAHRVARASCAACTIGCEHIYAVTSGQGSVVSEDKAPTTVLATGHWPLTTQVRLEYESLFALGPLCGVSDRDAILRAARLCDDLGMDTISAGATVAFAMECGERGLLAEPGLAFGRGDTVLSLLERIAHREGVGDLLAGGTRRAAALIGGDAADFAPHVKGLELPGYEPRALQAMALGFAVGTRGADHNRSGAYEADFSPRADRLRGDERSATLAVETEDRAALIDSLILCKFLRGVFADIWAESAELLRMVTGWDVNAEKLHAVARRVVTARKLFNIREGWTPAEDTLPKRFLTEDLPAAAAPGATLTADQLGAMIRTYNTARDWTPDGWVSDPAVHALDLQYIGEPGHEPAVSR